jgi:carbamoyl-phosphate synthase large subunit
MQKMGYTSLMINSNPETFSTDFDLADKLFFEPITHEYLDNILEKEKPYGVFIQFGGGTAINLAQYFKDKKIKVLGTDFFGIEASEDRKIFNKILADNNIPQAPGSGVLTLSDAIKTANKIGYPVLIRPSFVLGGQGMGIVHNDKDLTHYFNVIKTFDKKNSILIDKYLLGMEYEIDAISDGKNILIPAIMEQIEWAGVHSGDSMCVFPTTKLSDKNKKQIIAYAKILAKSLKIMGVFNIQYVVYDDELYIIEVNPRASRTIPYVSKITNIPIIDLSIDCIFGKKLENMNYGLDLYKNKNSVYAVKAPIFSFNKIKNADISLSPMMKSTGEILATDKDYYKALAKAFSSSGVKIKNKNVLIITEKRDLNKQNELIQAFKNKGFNVYLDSKDNIELVKTKIGLLIETKDNNINAKLRTTAINYRIPIFTSLYTALAFVESYNN